MALRPVRAAEAGARHPHGGAREDDHRERGEREKRDLRVQIGGDREAARIGGGLLLTHARDLACPLPSRRGRAARPRPRLHRDLALLAAGPRRAGAALRGHRPDAARPRRRPAAAPGRRRIERRATRPTTSSASSTTWASATAHFAGNSMGGALSLEMAKRGRARSVVAISPGGGWYPRTTRRGEARPALLRPHAADGEGVAAADRPDHGRPGSRRLALRDVMTRGDQVPAKEAARSRAHRSTATLVEERLQGAARGHGPPIGPRPGQGPTLVTWGTQGPCAPAARHARRFRDRDPRRRVPRASPGSGTRRCGTTRA